MALTRAESHSYIVEVVEEALREPGRRFPMEEINHIFGCDGCQIFAVEVFGSSPLCYLAEQVMSHVNRGQWPIHLLAHIRQCEHCTLHLPQKEFHQAQARRWNRTYSSGRQQTFTGNEPGKGRHRG